MTTESGITSGSELIVWFTVPVSQADVLDEKHDGYAGALALSPRLRGTPFDLVATLHGPAAWLDRQERKLAPVPNGTEFRLSWGAVDGVAEALRHLPEWKGARITFATRTAAEPSIEIAFTRKPAPREGAFRRTA